MKKYLAVLAVWIVAVVVVYGRQESGQSDSYTQITKTGATTSAKGSPTPVVVINQETSSIEKNGPAKNSDSYLRTLLSANNLPNDLLLLVGFGGVCVGIGTLKMMQKQIIIPYRARLALGDPQSPLGNEISFAVENYGQLAGLITYIDATIIILSATTGETSFHKSAKIDKAILPGKGNEISISFVLPNDIRIFGEGVQVMVNGLIDYDIGIKGQDQLTFSRLYLGKSEKWVEGKPVVGLIFTDADKTQNEKPQKDAV